MSRRSRQRPPDVACRGDVPAPQSPRARRFVALTLVAVIVSAGLAAASEEGELLRSIKSDVFDRLWPQVLTECDEYIASYPRSQALPRAYYYRAQALESLKRNEDAIEAYSDKLEVFNKLQKKATVRVNLPLAFADILLEAIDENYRRMIEDRLDEEAPGTKLPDFKKLLEAIRSGECPQTILEIDNDDAFIKVWIE